MVLAARGVPADLLIRPPVVVPVRTVQEAIAAGDIPPLDVDASVVFSQSERILQEHVRKHGNNASAVQDLIQKVLHHRDFNWIQAQH